MRPLKVERIVSLTSHKWYYLHVNFCNNKLFKSLSLASNPYTHQIPWYIDINMKSRPTTMTNLCMSGDYMHLFLQAYGYKLQELIYL